ncbi:UDP-glucose 6-dehydrogenase [Candidatus Shapirobacteria bacterium CG10_big_fil_rev_8_21_14_0_10_38_14]|uniref:UDP-glucose 6-dehydrogenase n=1 Tax=Candidatus Shapirobacteria bacterium CG10_big_fil_rev_8_21_14_0_10_38_14 TaxID=1974483 RepID=A0A2M8L5Q3_9BACT|nr:MAG: UDP-glucose 6-dehydrogenase [Candidatus Shapirobacteria bacterium CG10_big_fil_rev_8_21_14_0_10_38_14]
MNLVVIGAGFVGLVTAAVFADLKNKVWVVDNDKEKIKKLCKGKMPFFEPGLEELISKNLKAKCLHFTTFYPQVIPQAGVIFICVGTPNYNGKANLSYLYSAVKSIAKNLKKPTIIAIKSTVPSGINKEIEKLMKKYTKVNFDLASVPEFLSEGRAIKETLRPYRVVIGTKKKSVINKLLKLHKPIGGKRLICDSTSAQMIKYASNTFLPTKISFANAIAVLCDKFGADVNVVMRGMGMDRRIGPDFLGAGLGYGGSCLPKDAEVLIKLAKRKGYDFKILKAVQSINQNQIKYFVEKTIKACGGSIRGKIITVLGLAFKPNTSDMREARSIYVIKELKKQGAKVRACDPIAIPEAKKLISKVEFFQNPYQALKGAEAFLLVTEWEEYKNLDFKKIKKSMKSPIVIDGRNIYNRDKLKNLGFIYEGIGR